jgi:hypothetical protein
MNGLENGLRELFSEFAILGAIRVKSFSSHPDTPGLADCTGNSKGHPAYARAAAHSRVPIGCGYAALDPSVVEMRIPG